jgi:hypothetical protein
VSSWDDIKQVTQVIELSEEVFDWHEHWVTFDDNGNGSRTSSSGNRQDGQTSYNNRSMKYWCKQQPNNSRNDNSHGNVCQYDDNTGNCRPSQVNQDSGNNRGNQSKPQLSAKE